MATVQAQYIVNCSTVAEYQIVKAYLQQHYPNGVNGWQVTYTDNQRRVLLLKTDPNWSPTI